MKKTINKREEITVYDQTDTTAFINKNKKIKLEDLGFTLPAEAPTRVISLRLPTSLYNLIRSYSTNNDIPYQAYMKVLLAEGIKKTSPQNISRLYRHSYEGK
jgi:predicted DNA binding CopG/RHH family protein